MKLPLSQREHDVPDLIIGKLLKIANEDKKVISLGPGEPDFPLPEPLVEAVRHYSNKSNHYSPPQGLVGLRYAISHKLFKENAISADPNDIVVTGGSQEALFVTLNTILNPRDKVVVPCPSYMDYVPPIDMVGAYPLLFKLNDYENFLINPDGLRKFVSKHRPKAIIINTPSNPTGSVYTKKTLEEIADIAIDNDMYVISDEAYEKIVYDKEHVSFASLNGVRDIAITTQTFSKSYAMCGFRVGYVHAPSHVAQGISKLRLHTSIAASTISQLVAIDALRMNGKYIDSMVKEYKRRRDLIVPRLNDLGLRTTVPDGAFYAFSSIKHLPVTSFKFCAKMLKDAKVASVPGSEFGAYGEGYVRFSYATGYNRITEALDRIEKWMKKNHYL